MIVDDKTATSESWETNPEQELPAEEIPLGEQQHVSIVVPEKYRVDEESVAVWSTDEHGRTVITFDEEAHAKACVAEFLLDHGTEEATEQTDNET